MQDYFKDLSQHEEHLKLLKESGNFLIDVVTDPIAAEIKKMISVLVQQYSDLVRRYENYKQTEVIGRARSEYEDGVKRLHTWLSGAQTGLDQTVSCNHEALKEHLLLLEVS